MKLTFVIPASHSVIPDLPFVIPAKAGIQEISNPFQSVELGDFWIPGLSYVAPGMTTSVK